MADVAVVVDVIVKIAQIGKKRLPFWQPFLLDFYKFN